MYTIIGNQKPDIVDEKNAWHRYYGMSSATGIYNSVWCVNKYRNYQKYGFFYNMVSFFIIMRIFGCFIFTVHRQRFDKFINLVLTNQLSYGPNFTYTNRPYKFIFIAALRKSWRIS